MGYKLYTSKVITQNSNSFLEACLWAHNQFKYRVDRLGMDSTKCYDRYNIFTLTSANFLFYNLFKELNFHIRSYIGDDRPLWLQAWLNFHSPDEVLTKHGHNFAYHGYISIDPKNTLTIFNNFTIKNTPGQIYIGPGGAGYEHYVKVLEPFNGKRITIGFDIITEPTHNLTNLSFIPLI